MILITGATGTIGRALVRELGDARVELRVMTREPSKAESLLGSNVRVVRGDFADASSLAAALDGVDAVFLATAAGPAIVEHDDAMVRAAIGSRVRVRKIVKLSAFGADAASPLRVGMWHQEGERALMGSGLGWTLLRPAGFASNALAWAPKIRSGAPIQVATGVGRHPVIDPRDVAAVAARALLTDDHLGKGYTLTGPEPLSTPEQVAIVGEALGRPLSIDAVTPEVATERMRAPGVPEDFAGAVLEGLRFMRSGAAAAATESVETVLGRRGRTFEEWVRGHVELFR